MERGMGQIGRRAPERRVDARRGRRVDGRRGAPGRRVGEKGEPPGRRRSGGVLDCPTGRLRSDPLQA